MRFVMKKSLNFKKRLKMLKSNKISKRDPIALKLLLNFRNSIHKDRKKENNKKFCRQKDE